MESPNTTTTGGNGITNTALNTAVNEVVTVENQLPELQNEEVFFDTYDGNEVILFTDDTNPASVELRTTSTGSIASFDRNSIRRSVSFHTFPQPLNDGTNGVTGTNHMKQQRPALMRSTQSVPRMELLTGLVVHQNNNNNNNDIHNQPVREQYIKTITNIIPAGENSTAASKWRRLSQVIIQKQMNQSPPPSTPTNIESDAIVDDDDDDDEKNCSGDIQNDNASMSSAATKEIRHYRIRSRNRNEHSFWMVHTEIISNGISRFVTWTYRSSFYVTIVASYLLFMAIMILFALGIYLSGKLQPNCIAVGDYVFTGYFMDAVQLSWTTLATVGYGAVGPVVPGEDRKCMVINLLMAFESFLGVLFGGFATAVIIGKMARFQSIAHIVFSDWVCIKYGSAAVLDADDGEDDTNLDIDGMNSDPSASYINSIENPFPVLEFRMINILSGERGGEILNARVSVVVSVSHNDRKFKRHIQSISIRNSSSHSSNPVSMAAGSTLQAAKMVGMVGTRAVMTGATAVVSTAKYTGAALTCARKLTKGGSGSAFQQLLQQMQSTPKLTNPISIHDVETVQREMALMANEEKQEIREQVYVDEGNSTLVPPKIYYKLQVETDKHPYFKRVWTIRHILDENSPILSETVRDSIRSNSGRWPRSLCNAESIRECLCLNDIIISFSGTANASGRTVYGQKVYESSDIRIGYTFANVLALVNNRIVVNMDMIHDIREQIGGGAERESNS